MDVEQRLERIEEHLDLVLRAIRGEDVTGNRGLVRRVGDMEVRIERELAAARQVHQEIEDAVEANGREISVLKVKVAGYGFGGAFGGGGLLIGLLKAFGVI